MADAHAGGPPAAWGTPATWTSEQRQTFGLMCEANAETEKGLGHPSKALGWEAAAYFASLHGMASASADPQPDLTRDQIQASVQQNLAAVRALLAFQLEHQGIKVDVRLERCEDDDDDGGKMAVYVLVAEQNEDIILFLGNYDKHEEACYDKVATIDEDGDITVEDA